MSTHIINSDESAQRFIGVIREQYMSHRFLRVSVKTGKARSVPQNNITHVWYEQIARELREDDALGWKSYCKLHHGIAILRAEDEEFREIYDSTIKSMSYEQKLKVMRFFPVTSLMSKEQLSKFAEAVRDDFRNRGVMLEFPEVAA